MLHVFLLVLFFTISSISYANGAVHTLSEFKKLYLTYYILPNDLRYLKEKTRDFFLTGNLQEQFNDNKDNKYLHECFKRLKDHMKEKGFILVDSPREADAILAFRIQLAGYDVYHECSRGSSIRVIDPINNDIIMMLYSPGFEFLTLKRDVYDELNELIKVIDMNIDFPEAAKKFEAKFSNPVGVEYNSVEKGGIMLTTASIYPGRLCRQFFTTSLKDRNIMPIIVKLKNNTAQETVLKYKESIFNTEVIGDRNALNTYDTMKLVGQYDKLFEALAGSLFFGAAMGFGDMEKWSPENDEKEYAIVYHKFDPVVRIKPGEEVSGIMLFDLTPPKKDNKVITDGYPSKEATLTIILKGNSGNDIRIQTKINE
jgi:hypothetical protein